LVFAHHLDILDAIEDTVKKSEIKYVRIDGSTKNEQRQFNVDIFQKDEQCLIAILSITACATGITMTKASTVVFAEMYFTPAVMIQAEDRAHRIGQEHTCVNIHYLYGPNTLDELIYQKLLEKHFVVTETLDNKKLVMDIEKLTNGRIGDFEVRINNPNNEESLDENSKNVTSQLVMKKIQKKGTLKIEDYFESNKKSNEENKSKTKKLDKIIEIKENDEDHTKFFVDESVKRRSFSRNHDNSDDEYIGGKKFK
jgi:SWI/SNF-related matrix-associated actin-dependent regulator 1 of chromatin subfamily A